MNIAVKKKDAIWSYLGTFLSLGASFILLPFVLHYLSDDDVALYYVFVSLSYITTLFDMGFSPSIARSMAYAYSGVARLSKNGVEQADKEAPNYQLMKAIIKTCKTIYTILSLIALLLALTLGTYYIFYISSKSANITQNEPIYAWVIYSIAIFFNLLYSYYSVFLRGIGAIAQINKAIIISRLAQIALCVFLLVSGLGLIGVAIAFLVNGFVFRLLSHFMFVRFENIGSKLRDISNDTQYKIKDIFLAIWPNTWREGLVTVSNYLLNQTTIIIASLFLTLQQTGVFSLSTQMASAVIMIAYTLHSAFQPALQSAYANRDINAQRKYMSLILFSLLVTSLLGVIVLITVGIPLIHWLKPSYIISIPILLLICLYQFLLKYRDCFCSFISTTNSLVYYKSYIASSVICVLLSYLLTSKLSLQAYGLVIAQLISQLIFNVWYWPSIVYKQLDMKLYDIFFEGYTYTKSQVNQVIKIISK